MVAGTPTADAAAQPSLHEVKAMLTEAAKLHDGDAAPATPTYPQLAAMGPDDHYIIECGGSYIRSYMCCNESSHTAERGVAHPETPSNGDDDKKKISVEKNPVLYDLSCHSEDQIAVCHGVGVDCDQNGQMTGPQVASCSPPICACHQRPGKILN
ncbi:hypothetical protein PG997_006364 [Apiospora hydei]|uniref:Uncharacterized protein n=1 Tax=Apiospora hydei TaxID=1337664 RepID=A0ABR1WNL1_9PEZI